MELSFFFMHMKVEAVLLLQEKMAKFPLLSNEAEVQGLHRYRKHICKGCE